MLDEEETSYEAILQRMLDRIPDTMDKREGSIIYDALAPAAAELAQLYIWLINAIDLTFADTAVDEYLERICNQIGIVRKEATSAIKQGSFYNENDELIDVDIGTRYTCDGLYWIVMDKLETGKYKLECETAGVIGNNVTGNLIPVDYVDNLAVAILTDLLIPR